MLHKIKNIRLSQSACKTVFVRNITPSLRKIRKAPLLLLLPAIGLNAFLDRKSDFGLGFLHHRTDAVSREFDALIYSPLRVIPFAELFGTRSVSASEGDAVFGKIYD